MKLKYDWEYGENEDGMKYYMAHTGADRLWVFNAIYFKRPDLWLGQYSKGNRMVCIGDKKRLNRERKKRGLSSGCGPDLLGLWADLSSTDPEYMKAKVEWCYRYGVSETN